MRKLLCSSCGADKQAGRHQSSPAYSGPFIGPGEWERVAVGLARIPQAVQRRITVTVFGPAGEETEVHQLDVQQYSCDSCGGAIRPGEKAVAWTVWHEGGAEPPVWEDGYLAVVLTEAESEAVHERTSCSRCGSYAHTDDNDCTMLRIAEGDGTDG